MEQGGARVECRHNERRCRLRPLGRPLRSLRLSVTDRCNLRCHYCMPEAGLRVAAARRRPARSRKSRRSPTSFRDLGVDRVRLTGGEPLLRRDLPRSSPRSPRKPGVRDLALTTNGVLLAAQAAPCSAPGLHRITVSLDTLQPRRFNALTRFDELDACWPGIDAAARAGFARSRSTPSSCAASTTTS